MVKDVIQTIDRTLKQSYLFPVSHLWLTGLGMAVPVVAAAAVKLGFKKIEARCSTDIHYADEIAKVVRHIVSLCVLLNNNSKSYLPTG